MSHGSVATESHISAPISPNLSASDIRTWISAAVSGFRTSRTKLIQADDPRRSGGSEKVKRSRRYKHKQLPEAVWLMTCESPEALRRLGVILGVPNGRSRHM
jgi:hypothetical protein